MIDHELFKGHLDRPLLFLRVEKSAMDAPRALFLVLVLGCADLSLVENGVIDYDDSLLLLQVWLRLLRLFISNQRS